MSAGSKLSEDLKIDDLIPKVFMELTKTSKHTATGKYMEDLIYMFLEIINNLIFDQTGDHN